MGALCQETWCAAINALDLRVAIGYLQSVTADELKRKREKLGVTQAELAKRLGLTKITVLRYENGQREIPRAIELALKEIERQS